MSWIFSLDRPSPPDFSHSPFFLGSVLVSIYLALLYLTPPQPVTPMSLATTSFAIRNAV
jgi:hypothetical protein